MVAFHRRSITFENTKIRRQDVFFTRGSNDVDWGAPNISTPASLETSVPLWWQAMQRPVYLNVSWCHRELNKRTKAIRDI